MCTLDVCLLMMRLSMRYAPTVPERIAFVEIPSVESLLIFLNVMFDSPANALFQP